MLLFDLSTFFLLVIGITSLAIDSSNAAVPQLPWPDEKSTSDFLVPYSENPSVLLAEIPTEQQPEYVESYTDSTEQQSGPLESQTESIEPLSELQSVQPTDNASPNAASPENILAKCAKDKGGRAHGDPVLPDLTEMKPCKTRKEWNSGLGRYYYTKMINVCCEMFQIARGLIIMV